MQNGSSFSSLSKGPLKRQTFQPRKDPQIPLSPPEELKKQKSTNSVTNPNVTVVRRVNNVMISAGSQIIRPPNAPKPNLPKKAAIPVQAPRKKKTDQNLNPKAEDDLNPQTKSTQQQPSSEEQQKQLEAELRAMEAQVLQLIQTEVQENVPVIDFRELDPTLLAKCRFVNNNSFLHLLVFQKRRLKLLESYLSHKDKLFNIDNTNRFEQTALHLACLHNNPQAVALLLQSSAEVTLEDVNGEQPIEVALQLGHSQCVELLLPFVQQEDLWKVLEVAIRYYRFYAIEYLYEKLNVLPVLKHIHEDIELKIKWERYLEWAFYMPLLFVQSESKQMGMLGKGVIKEIQKFL